MILQKRKRLLITEAIWTRYMPSRKMINDIIESGVIGEVTAVTANLSYTVSHVERIRKPELAGGALLGCRRISNQFCFHGAWR